MKSFDGERADAACDTKVSDETQTRSLRCPSDSISPHSDIAAGLLVDGLFDEAVRRLPETLPVTTEIALARALDVRLARLGYLTRSIELERFAIARSPSSWLVERLVAQPEDSIADVAIALAAEEPLGDPAPESGSPTWRVPGPGGHVRHSLALRGLGDAAPELKRSWLLGFFVRCCQDAAADPEGWLHHEVELLAGAGGDRPRQSLSAVRSGRAGLVVVPGRSDRDSGPRAGATHT